MNQRFVHKYFVKKPKVVFVKNSVEEAEVKPAAPKEKNKRTKKNANMVTKEQIEAAEVLANDMVPEVKVVKKDRGLIERTESSKIILTEDNRQVLND